MPVPRKKGSYTDLQIKSEVYLGAIRTFSINYIETSRVLMPKAESASQFTLRSSSFCSSTLSSYIKNIKFELT